MTKIVDARGLSCPQPVILTWKAIETGEFPVEILLDTVTARQNVQRVAKKSGLKVQIEDVGDEFKVTLTK